MIHLTENYSIYNLGIQWVQHTGYAPIQAGPPTMVHAPLGPPPTTFMHIPYSEPLAAMPPMMMPMPTNSDLVIFTTFIPKFSW